MQEMPPGDVGTEGSMPTQVIQPTVTVTPNSPETTSNQPIKNPKSVFLHVFFIVLFLLLLLFPLVADVVLSHKNTARMSQVTATAQAVLGSNIGINTDNLALRCYQAAKPEFFG
jgi:hypothetical protein